MSDHPNPGRDPEVGPDARDRREHDELMAIPRIADHVGVTPRVLRYWEDQGLISPSREHGKLRYTPRDMAIARLTKRLMDTGVGVEGVRMLKSLADRDIRRAGTSEDPAALLEAALVILYQRKAFREVTGLDEEHYPEGTPPARPDHPGGHGPRHGPGRAPHEGGAPRGAARGRRRGPEGAGGP